MADPKHDDLTGLEFGFWTVIAAAPHHFTPSGQIKRMWRCECKCGTLRNVQGASLRAGSSISCGCQVKRLLSQSKHVDLCGKVFGLLTVKKWLGRKNNTYRYECACACGRIVQVNTSNLCSGRTRSCGCQDSGFKTRHGDAKQAQFVRILKSYRWSATCRNLIWELSDEDAIAFFMGPCWYCGEEPSNIWKSRRKNEPPLAYTGIDRIDSSLGYSISNVVGCCMTCNRMKGTLTRDVFIAKCIKIIQHQGNHE